MGFISWISTCQGLISDDNQCNIGELVINDNGSVIAWTAGEYNTNLGNYVIKTFVYQKILIPG